MKNKYIISGVGFFAGFVDEKAYPKEATWTDNLSYAKSYTGNQAKQVVSQLCNVNCFVWSPFKQLENIETKYRVVRRRVYNIDIYDDLNVLEWIIVKNYDDSNDFNTLKGFVVQQYELYDYETAVQVARERNLKMLQELNDILEKTK